MDKRWIWGCGGCLGLVLIAAIVLGGVTWWGVGSFMEGTQKTAKEVFGEKLPSNYTALFGMPFDMPEGRFKMVMMMNAVTQNMLIAVETTAKPKDIEQLRSGDATMVKSFIEQVTAKSQSGTGNIKELTLEHIQPVETTAGPVRAMQFKMETEKGFTPLLVTPLTYDNNQVKFILLMNPQTSATSADTDFSAEYQQLTAHQEEMLRETKLTEGMIPTTEKKG